MVWELDESRASRRHTWGKRLRIVAAIVSIVAGIPGTLATIAFFAKPPPLAEKMPEPSGKRIRLGHGRCSVFHVFRDGKCRDVR
jgi:hypothetical protein